MTSPGGRIVARVGVRVLPNTATFRRSLDRFMQRVERTLRVEIPAVLGTSGLDAEIAALRERIGRVRPVRIPVEYDRPAVPPQPTRVPPVRVPMDPLAADFERQVRSHIARIARTVTAEVPLTTRGEELRRRVAVQIAEIERTMSVGVPTDATGAAEYRRRLARLVREASTGVEAEIRVSVQRGALDRIRGLFGRARSETSAFDALAGSISKVGTAASAAGSAGFQGFSRMARGVGLVGVAAAAVQIIIPLVVTSVVGLLGLIVAAVGAAAAGLGGLPVLLTALLAPIAAVAVGFEGIKRAGSASLGEDIDRMRRVVEHAWEYGMRPVFNQLKAVFPTLTTGLGITARAASRFALALAEVVTSKRGLSDLRTAFVGVRTVLDRSREGAVRLLESLLAVAGTRELYVILGDTIGGIAERFAGMLTRMRVSGDLTRGLERLRDLLFGLTDMLAAIAERSLQFFIGAGPGITEFFAALTRTFGRVDWESLGESFGRMMERIGKVIEDVPPETWRQLGDAIGEMIDRFIRLGESGGLIKLVDGMTGLVNTLNALTRVAEFDPDKWILGMLGLGDATKQTAEQVSADTEDMSGTVGTSVTDMTDRVSESLSGMRTSFAVNFAEIYLSVTTWLDETTAAIGAFAAQTVLGITTFFSELPGRVGGFLSTLPEQAGYWLGLLATTMWIKSAETVSGVGVWFATLPEQVGGFVSETANRASGFFSELPGKLQTFAAQTVLGVVEQFLSMRDQASDSAEDLRDRVSGFFSELPRKLQIQAGLAVQAVIGTFKEMPGKVAVWAAQTVYDVVQWFKDLPGTLKQLGRDAIQGFINGIKEKAREVAAAAIEVVTGAIRGAREAIQPGSPSKVFRRLGILTGLGFEQGILDTRDRVIAAIRRIIDTITGLFRGVGTDAMRGYLDGMGISAPELGDAVDKVFREASASIGGQVTAQLGDAAPGLSQADLTSAVLAALNQAQWQVRGDDLALAVNRANALLART